MIQLNIKIENLKCNGCAATIKKGLLKYSEVTKVDVNVEESNVIITFDGDEDNTSKFKTKLASLGYPETGNNNTLSVAKSFVSCAIGRITK